jgi:hypothetical protein
MHQKIKYRFAPFTFWLVMALYATRGSNLLATPGADFARSTLDRALSRASYAGASNYQQRDAALDALRNETSNKLSHMSEEDRIDYVEYMAVELSKGGIDGPETTDRSTAAFMFISAGTSAEEMVIGGSRLLSSDDPAARRIGEDLVMVQDSVKLANGEMGHDMSLYDRPLHDPKVPRDRLIEILFKHAPVESAQWFADHTGLSAGDRATLEPDLQKGWQILHVVSDPRSNPETRAIMDDSVMKPLLDQWLESPSWILRALANGLLQDPQEYPNPNLRETMKPVRVPIPVGLQISSGKTK